MKNIFNLIIIIVAVAIAVAYSVNIYHGKKITDSPLSIIEVPQKSKTASEPEKTVQEPEGQNPAVPMPLFNDQENADLYLRIDKMENNLNNKLGAISETSDKTEILSRLDQVSKQLEADVSMMLSAVNKKEIWYKNEFYQLLAAVGAVFVLLLSVSVVMYVSLKKLIQRQTAAEPEAGYEPDDLYVEKNANETEEISSPIIDAVNGVSAALAEKIASAQYLFDPEKTIKLTGRQKAELIEITDELLFLDKAGVKPSPEEYYLLGLERFAEKSYSEASAIFEHLTQTSPDFSQAWFMYGYIAYSGKKYETAYESMLKACLAEPDNFTYLYSFGSACIKMKKFDEAADALSKAVKLNSKDAALWNNLANSYVQCGKTEAAVDAFRKAVELKPDFNEAHHNLGLALSRLERYEEAAAAFEKAVEAKPDKHESMYNAACVYALLGKRADALKHLKKAVELSPEYAKKAKQDKDFESFAGDAEFTKITG